MGGTEKMKRTEITADILKMSARFKKQTDREFHRCEICGHKLSKKIADFDEICSCWFYLKDEVERLTKLFDNNQKVCYGVCKGHSERKNNGLQK
jgi:hypothetical protein